MCAKGARGPPGPACYLHFDLSRFPERSERLDELQRSGSVVAFVHGHVQLGHDRSTIRDVDVVGHESGMRKNKEEKINVTMQIVETV